MVSFNARAELLDAQTLVSGAYNDMSSNSEPKTCEQTSQPSRSSLRESNASGGTTSPATSPTLLHREQGEGAGVSNTFVRYLHARLAEVQREQESGANFRSVYKRTLSQPWPNRRSRSLYDASAGSTLSRKFESISTLSASCEGHQVEPVVPSHNIRLKRKLSATDGLLPLGNKTSSPSKKRVRWDGTIALTKPILRTASLRKAASLRTNGGLMSEELVPTEPVTPDKFSNGFREEDSLCRIPIISPSRKPVPRLPLSTEMTAKIRLGKYKEREGRNFYNDRARCGRLVLDNDGRNVEPVSETIQPSTAPWGTREDWEGLLGLGRQMREERIDWLLQCLPAISEPDSTASSFSSTSSDDSLDSRVYPCSQGSRLNLINQLITSPETKFHAAWMFLRYYYLEGMGKKLSGGIDLKKHSIYSENVIWDATLASLAISVKFHRDFLSPLLPVLATDYMDISPHRMGYQAFELAQRRMLSAFSYELGITPQPFLDQIWIALPSLRKLLKFEGGWNQAKKETWRILLNSLYAPDVMKFLVSVLTTTALAKAIVLVLSQQYNYDSEWNSHFNFTRIVRDRGSVSKVAPRFEIAARENAEEVIIDVQAVIGISDTELEECRCWLDLSGC